MDRAAKIKISYVGLGAAVAALLSIVLSFTPVQLFILSWINFFGETIGWLIRIALLIGGLFVYYAYDQADEEDSDSAVDSYDK